MVADKSAALLAALHTLTRPAASPEFRPPVWTEWPGAHR